MASNHSRARIALIFEFGTLNGGEHSMLAVLDQLPRDEFDFVAIAPQPGRLAAALRERGIVHVPLRLRDEAGARLPREQVCENLMRAIEAAAPDLVHANSLSMGRLTGAIAHRLPIPCIAHLRDIIKLSRAAIGDLNRNNRLLAVSQATQAFHVKQGLDPGRVRVLYNGVDCQQFAPRPATGWLRRELGISAESLLVLTVGQIGLRKGQDLLAEAAVLLKSPLPHVHYLLAGERNSSKAETVRFEQAVIERFAAAGMQDRLYRLGYRDDIPQIMNEADLLVHPAHEEPLGRVLLEAAASGLPIVATRVGGTPEILQDGDSARLVEPKAVDPLAAAMLELCTSPDLRARFARTARQQVETRFPIEQAARNLADVWRSELGERQRE